MLKYATICASAAAIACLSLAPSALAQTVMVTLTGDAERPPVDTPGSGTATVTFDTTTREISISGSYSNLTSNVSGAHLHGLADADSNAGILFGLSVDGGQSGNFSGSGTLSANDFDGFMNDLTYINLHTTTNPGGEIRGQVVIPEPTSGFAALAAGGLLLRRRRRG